MQVQQAIQHDLYYSILNEEKNGHLCVPSGEVQLSEPDPSTLRAQHWLTNSLPFLGFIPKFNPWHGKLFGRLNIYNKIWRTRKGQYILCKDIRDSWLALEHTLRTFSGRTLEVVYAPLPKSFVCYTWPHQYRYAFHHDSHAEATEACRRARDAFLPLIALASFALMLAERLEMKDDTSNWRDQVIARGRLHPQLLAEIEDSIISDFDIPRVGGFIDVDHCEFLSLLPLMLDYNMPIVLKWNPQTHSIRQVLPPHDFPPELVCAVPSNEQLAHLAANSRGVPSQAPKEAEEPRAPFPPVEPFSHQKQGETMEAFFARRERQLERYLSTETPDAQRRRLRRETYAAQQRFPGIKGARMFLWDNVDGYRIRRSAAAHEETWYYYTDSQRRYNSQFNEWDLCSEFAPDDVPDMSGWDDEPTSPVEDAMIVDEDNYLNKVGQDVVMADMARMYPTPAVPDMNDYKPSPLLDVAYEIFGCNDDGVSELPSSEHLLDWASTTKCLGMSSKGEDTSLSEDQRLLVRAFFTAMASASSLSNVPPSLCDLRQDDTDIFGSWDVDLSVCRRIDSPGRYTIECGNPQLTVSPFAMAYTARGYHNLKPSSTAGIAVELTKRGFRVDLHFDQGFTNSVPFPRPRTGGLGYRSANYQPNKWDYFSYVHLRDSFLHSPRGFAALLHGGVIGRMAREVVNPEILLEALLDPEPDAAYFEPLSENEIALLCGAYEFDTGKTSNAGKAQYANVSWWPRPTTWNKSTLSGPCWTEDAERWYVDRHRTLMKGNFSVNAVLTAAKWKSSLRFTAKISKILHKIQGVTTEYLDGRIRSV